MEWLSASKVVPRMWNCRYTTPTALPFVMRVITLIQRLVGQVGERTGVMSDHS